MYRKRNHAGSTLAMLPLMCAVAVSATFSAAELLPDIGNHAAWLEIDEDGKPLSETNAPMSLLVPDDIKPARWVHGVGTITVLDATAAATSRSRSESCDRTSKWRWPTSTAPR